MTIKEILQLRNQMKLAEGTADELRSARVALKSAKPEDSAELLRRVQKLSKAVTKEKYLAKKSKSSNAEPAVVKPKTPDTWTTKDTVVAKARNLRSIRHNADWLKRQTQNHTSTTLPPAKKPETKTSDTTAVGPSTLKHVPPKHVPPAKEQIPAAKVPAKSETVTRHTASSFYDPGLSSRPRRLPNHIVSARQRGGRQTGGGLHVVRKSYTESATGEARKFIDNPRQTGSGRRIIKELPHSEAIMSLSDRILDEAKGARFKSLEKKEAKKGAKNPAGLAAWIGREKYGKSKFQSLAKAGKKSYSEGESVSSLADRILEGKKDCKPWNSSNFQTKLKSKKPWGATNFQTAGKGYSEDKAEIFGLVDSLVELRNSFVK